MEIDENLGRLKCCEMGLGYMTIIPIKQGKRKEVKYGFDTYASKDLKYYIRPICENRPK